MDQDALIAELCQTEGLEFLGCVALEEEADYQRYRQWLSDGLHGGMEYLERNHELRGDPRKLLAGSKSAIVFAWRYGPVLGKRCGPRVAAYAWRSDYHRIMRKKGERLWRAFAARDPNAAAASFRICIDSAPLLERALAARTRSGFVGKNTCYIKPGIGSFLLLGEILTTLDLPLDIAAAIEPTTRSKKGGCGTCQRCQVHCPTGALDEAYRIDAKRCLSYWTIEHRGLIPEEYWPFLGRYWYGCDICQDVCPYNRSAIVPALEPDLDLAAVALMDQATYEKLFGGTAMTRAKRTGLRRNALIALHVTADARLENVLREAADDSESVIRDTVAAIYRRVSAGP